MKYTLSFALLFTMLSFTFSQKILLEKDVSNSYKNIKGPNTKSFGQLYFNYGLIVDESSDSEIEIKVPNSCLWSVGYRQKYKISGFWSFGYEIGMRFSQFHIRQSDTKIFPNTVIHDKEKVKLYSGRLGFYNRINIGRRGNIIGKYIDIGGYACYHFNSVHFTKDDISGEVASPDVDVYAKTRITKNKGLEYIEPIEYGVFGRAGINKFAIVVNYRLSDIFKTGYFPDELPALDIGIELSLFN